MPNLGLSLMYTPHPSYPPLDLAACGGVIVTNRFGRKRSLDQYSPNILCADLDVPSLVAALRNASCIAADRPLREANFASSGLQRDWSVSLAPALERLTTWAQA
jgi:O-antigen biosynthesis protein